MKVIASIQAKGASSRGLVHYIAHSKVDAVREPQGRELFNEHSDQIPVEKVNDFLNNGIKHKRPGNDGLHHLVLSLKPEDYERLGMDEKERLKSLKEITRHAVKQFQNEIKANKVAWAGGIHLNTAHPHVHIAIRKEYFDQNLEQKSLPKIPVSLLPHYDQGGEKKTLQPGVLIGAATEKLEEIQLTKAQQISQQKIDRNSIVEKDQEKSNSHSKTAAATDAKTNDQNEKEREILAGAILAKFYLEKTQENLDSLVNHGEQRRFGIFDEITKKTRKMSLLDLERRAEKRATQFIKKSNLTDPVKKEEVRKNLIENELEKNAAGIKRIKTILHNLIVKENQNLRKREDNYRRIKPLAEKIRVSSKTENKKLPVPLLNFDDLEMLQSRSLEKKDLRSANYFERVRREASLEQGIPTRSDEEVAKLKGRKILTDLKTGWQEKQLKDFENRRHIFPVEIDGKKWTLSTIDSLIKKHSQDEQKIMGKINQALRKIGLTDKKSSLPKLEAVRAAITEKLHEKTEQMRSELNGTRSVQKTLEEFYQNDTNSRKEKLPAKFTTTELAEVESLAFNLRLTDTYRENWEQQKQLLELSDRDSDFNPQNGKGSINEAKQDFIAGRECAREIFCRIEVARAKQELANFKKNKDYQKFAVTNPKTGSTRYVSLSEIGLKTQASLFEQTIEYFMETAEIRAIRCSVEKQVAEKGGELKENLRSAADLLKTAEEIARDSKTTSFFGKTPNPHQPIFTPQELLSIENRAVQTANKSEADNLGKILDSVDHSKAKNLPAILESFAAEKKSAETIENSSVSEEKSSIKIANDCSRSDVKIIKIKDNEIEIINQEKGR